MNRDDYYEFINPAIVSYCAFTKDTSPIENYMEVVKAREEAAAVNGKLVRLSEFKRKKALK